jgi:hypothetical protein
LIGGFENNAIGLVGAFEKSVCRASGPCADAPAAIGDRNGDYVPVIGILQAGDDSRADALIAAQWVGAFRGDRRACDLLKSAAHGAVADRTKKRRMTMKNPLDSLWGTIISGLILTAILYFAVRGLLT